MEHITVDRASGTAVWLDLGHAGTPRAVIDASDLALAETQSGTKIRPGDIVLVRTGWIDANIDDVARCLEESPGLTKEAGEWLRERDIKALGVDLMSPDRRDAVDIPIHMNFLRPRSIGRDDEDYILIYEGLRNISAIKTRRFFFWGLPLPLTGATGTRSGPWRSSAEGRAPRPNRSFSRRVVLARAGRRRCVRVRCGRVEKLLRRVLSSSRGQLQDPCPVYTGE